MNRQLNPLRHLEEMALSALKVKHPSFPDHAMPKVKYSDTTANGLTRAIVDYLNLIPQCAGWRVNNTGIYQEAKPVKGDQNEGIRNRPVMTKGFWRPGARKGLADISGIYKGKSLQIEVKIGKDKLSPDQIKMMEEVKAAGGLYYVAQSFSEFYEWFNTEVREDEKAA